MGNNVYHSFSQSLAEGIVCAEIERTMYKYETLIIDVSGRISEYFEVAQRINASKSTKNNKKANMISLNGEKRSESINPCFVPDTLLNEANIDATIRKKGDYFVSFLEEIQEDDSTALQRNAIYRACNNMYNNYVEKKRTAKEGMTSASSPNFAEFYNYLVLDNTPESNKLAMIFEPYCVGNYTLRNMMKLKTFGKVTVLDLTEVSYRNLNIALIAVIGYLDGIITSKKGNGRLSIYIPSHDDVISCFGIVNELLQLLRDAERYNISVNLMGDAEEYLITTSLGKMILEKFDNFYTLDNDEDDDDDE